MIVTIFERTAKHLILLQKLLERKSVCDAWKRRSVLDEICRNDSSIS